MFCLFGSGLFAREASVASLGIRKIDGNEQDHGLGLKSSLSFVRFGAWKEGSQTQLCVEAKYFFLCRFKFISEAEWYAWCRDQHGTRV